MLKVMDMLLLLIPVVLLKAIKLMFSSLPKMLLLIGDARPLMYKS